jgi:hypothetical protein
MQGGVDDATTLRASRPGKYSAAADMSLLVGHPSMMISRRPRNFVATTSMWIPGDRRTRFITFARSREIFRTCEIHGCEHGLMQGRSGISRNPCLSCVGCAHPRTPENCSTCANACISTFVFFFGGAHGEFLQMGGGKCVLHEMLRVQKLS